MAGPTSIEWTDCTWNVTRGCSRVSEGCEHCYAEREAHRHSGSGGSYEGLTERTAGGITRWTGEVRFVPDALDIPTRWKEPRRIFVNSMSDLFHPGLKDDEIYWVVEVIRECPQHHFQILTKRPERLAKLDINWPPNLWMGVSVESSRYYRRIALLRACEAHVRFLSLEPLLGPMPELDLAGVSWVIVGGESGPGARPMHPDWVRAIRDRCVRERVPFFFKQWGGVTNKKGIGRLLDGAKWSQFPVDLGVAP